MYFAGVGVNLANWDFLGHTVVTSNYIRLTPDLQSKSGALWNYSVYISCVDGQTQFIVEFGIFFLVFFAAVYDQKLGNTCNI